MRLEAIYDRGKLSFAQPVKLWNDHARLVGNVPDDDERVLQPQPSSKLSASATRDRLNAILCQYRSSGGASSHAEYKAIWHAHLEDKYLVRR